jgi:two-component system phosphate regulon response regulator PhoB
MSSIALKGSVPGAAAETASSNDQGGHPLRSMVIASKRFGPREWFVIHPVDGVPDAGVGESLQELHAPLVVPIIVVAASTSERDRIIGDLKRYIDATKQRSGEEERSIIQIDELRVDRHAHRVSVGDEEVVLTNLEFRLLTALIERRDRVQSRGALLQEVWGLSAHNTTRTVDTHVKRLRDKLRTAGRFLQSVRGIGYRFSQRPQPYDRGDRETSPRIAVPHVGPSRSAGAPATPGRARAPLAAP